MALPLARGPVGQRAQPGSSGPGFSLPSLEGTAGTQGGAGWPSWADHYLWIQLGRGQVPRKAQAGLVRTGCPTWKQRKVGCGGKRLRDCQAQLH